MNTVFIKLQRLHITKNITYNSGKYTNSIESKSNAESLKIKLRGVLPVGQVTTFYLTTR